MWRKGSTTFTLKCESESPTGFDQDIPIAFYYNWHKIPTPSVLLFPPCRSLITLLQPHRSSFFSSNTSSVFRAQAIWTCCSFCQECLLPCFLIFLSSNRAFSGLLWPTYLKPSFMYIPLALCSFSVKQPCCVTLLSNNLVYPLSSVFP